MRIQNKTLIILFLLLPFALSTGRAQQGRGINASGTIFGSVIQSLLDYKIGGACVYAYTLAQSRRLQAIDESAYNRAHAPGLAEGEAAAIEDRNAAALVDLIPKLPRAAMTYSDIRGQYLLRNLASGRRYCLVAFQTNESGIILAVKITPALKEGEKLKVDIREDVPWKDRFKIKP